MLSICLEAPANRLGGLGGELYGHTVLASPPSRLARIMVVTANTLIIATSKRAAGAAKPREPDCQSWHMATEKTTLSPPPPRRNSAIVTSRALRSAVHIPPYSREDL